MFAFIRSVKSRLLLLLRMVGISGNFRKRDKLRFTIHAADHCNLNCQSCDHYSSIAQEHYLDIQMYERDCTKLSELAYMGGAIEEIRIAGGEPLLHQNIVEIVKITRKYFINSNIDIITNGILLQKMPSDFWDTCANCDVRIQVTKYPINIDFEPIRELAKKNNVRFEFFGNAKIIKTSYLLPLDLHGRQNIKRMFSMCSRANNCIQLEAGFIYTCSLPLTIKHFNKFFGLDIQTTENDRINIYEVKSIEEILDFCRKPIPFCRFCDIKRAVFGKKWAISKRNISEWT